MSHEKKIKQFSKNLKKSAHSKPENMESEPNAAFNWFPGHMLKARRDIIEKLSSVDLVIEIRDARLPTVSGNPSLHQAISGKSKLILLNKVNLTDKVMVKEWEKWFKAEGVPFLFINCLEKAAFKLILSMAKKVIEEKRQTSSPNGVKPKNKYRFMIVGLPNTGKSTFINQLSSRNATKTANKPAQTRNQIWVNVDEHLELLDTPGIMPPEVQNDDHRLWLSIINAIPDSIVGEEDPACFLIQYFLKKESLEFKERYKLDTFDLTNEQFLLKVATLRGCLKQGGAADLDRVYKIILADFRSGILGNVCFETPPV